jgi:DNA polymerase-3 subunit epsilon
VAHVPAEPLTAAAIVVDHLTMASFVAVDVETANPQTASVCQVAAVAFDGERVAGRWASLVHQVDFSPINTRLHGLRAADVAGAPRVEDVLPQLRAFLEGRPAVMFSPFTRGSLDRAAELVGVERVASSWVDVLRLVRRHLPSVRAGFALSDVAAQLRVPLERPHYAPAEAEAAGRVLLEVAARAGRPLAELLEVAPPTVGAPGPRGGPLTGETVVFTGALVMVRADAAAIAEEAGAAVDGNVTKRTTVLVVGDQDVRIVGADGKSSKHEKAEKLIEAGQPIRIVGESDFFALVRP